MNNIKLIASDMDHTLLTEKGKLPPKFSNYIEELDKLNINFVIASGRPLYTLEKLFNQDKHRINFISDNGGAICYKGELIFKSLLDPNVYLDMIKFIEKETTGAAVLCGLDSGYILEKHKLHEEFLRTFYSKLTFIKNFDNLDIEANKLSIYFPNKDSKEYYEKVFKTLYSLHFSVTIGDSIWLDIMNKGINKGQALQILGKRLEISPDQMMAFGDTYNDIEMLQSVKHSYIVNNANNDMHKHANFITDSNDQFGVLKAIDKVIQAYNTVNKRLL
jgi:Cof subfamily protein (haloacid dehalogenase superfamily)